MVLLRRRSRGTWTAAHSSGGCHSFLTQNLTACPNPTQYTPHNAQEATASCVRYGAVEHRHLSRARHSSQLPFRLMGSQYVSFSKCRLYKPWFRAGLCAVHRFLGSRPEAASWRMGRCNHDERPPSLMKYPLCRTAQTIGGCADRFILIFSNSKSEWMLDRCCPVYGYNFFDPICPF